MTQSWRLASLVFHLTIISSFLWYASYALVWHAALLLDFVERLLGSTSGNRDGIRSIHKQLLALAVQATPASSLVLTGWSLMLVYNNRMGVVK